MFDRKIYIERRKALHERLSSGLVLLPGNDESAANYPDNTYRFRQDSTFLYFFGLNRPKTVGLLDLDSGEDILYGDDTSLEDIIWTGPQPTLTEWAYQVGVEHTQPISHLYKRIEAAAAKGRRIHYLPPYRAETILHVGRLLGLMPDRVAAHASIELARAVVALREVKASCEIEEIEFACGIASRMHRLAMRMCRPGTSEREIAGAIEGVALQYGAGVSFPSIVTQNGQTLHNHDYSGTLQSGRLMLVDAGAETTMNYCSDFTRTFPVSGYFTPKQKEIYDIVQAANRRVFELAHPGAYYYQMHNEAARVIAEGLRSLGLMRGNMEDAVAVGAQALFMPHGLGHQMGLDVHDMENIGEKYVGYDEETLRSSTPGLSSLRMGKRLREGHVITVEPGIYFIPDLIDKWEVEGFGRDFINFAKVREYLDFGGIRIEDNMLITPYGNRLLGSDRPPVTTSEIESYMNNN